MKHNTSQLTVLDKALLQSNKELQASFLKEWTPEQFNTMERAITGHFHNNWLRTTNKGEFIPAKRSFDRISEILGLAYTSSSYYAGYWVCSAELLHGNLPGYHYVGFALGTDNKGYAVLWDKDENEIIIEL